MARKAKKAAEKGARTHHEKLIKGLSHPMRVKILDYMNNDEWGPRGLSKELDEGLSNISYHVKVLLDLGLIRPTRTEPRRGAVAHFYRAVEPAFVPAGMARHIPKSGQHIIGSDILEKIDSDVAVSLEAGTFFERNDWHVSWTPVDLDSEACAAAEKLADEFVEGLLNLSAESALRLAKGDGDPIPISAALLVFGSKREKKKAPAKRRAKKKGKK